MHGSPTRKSMSRSEERINWLKSDDSKNQKSDLSKSEIVRTHSMKKDLDEGGLNIPGSDVFSLEEVCGSVSSQSDTRTIVYNDSSSEAAMESSTEDSNTLNLQENVRNENVERKEDKIEQVKQQTNSFYVKNLLAEAMGEDSMTRETSPTLSEKR